jgi:hypothetical protein
MSQVQGNIGSKPIEAARRSPEVVLFATLLVAVAAISLALILMPAPATSSPTAPDWYTALRAQSLREYGPAVGGMSVTGTARIQQDHVAREYGMAPVIASSPATAQQLFEHAVRENRGGIAPVVAPLFEHTLRENGLR